MNNTRVEVVKLQHHEVPAKLDMETGSFEEIKKRSDNIPSDKEVWLSEATFTKTYNPSWKFLRAVLTPLEYTVAHTLALMAKANTNSLEPLNDDTTIPELIEVLGVSKNKVRPILNRLFSLGVYARFEVARKDVPYTKFWILNPYLSFFGKLISSDIANLFKGTIIEKEYHKSV